MINKENKSHIIPVAIEDEMKESYLTYAMSVIVSRALPDVRDGLKPVHRRILYAMNELGVLADKPYKKSAAVVGEVLGKYHPHGDLAVYNALVRMAQDFSMRYLLIDGQGNFGSVDGDAPAAMRYTETRITPLSMEMLRDIKKNTVDNTPNYDDSLTEPTVLPAYIPNLLINGATGIAVGMATSIPPHNLNEVINATINIIDNFDIAIEEIMQYIKGPDFPTKGVIYGEDEIKNAYLTGRGKVTVRGRTEIEELKGNREAIIIYEIPYQVNKAELIIKIASHVKSKRIEGISDIRDESDRTGMRIVIELKKGANTDIILNQLFAHTSLQITFSLIMLALVNRQPKVLNIKEILLHYIKHRKDILIRRTKFDLNKANARSHIVQGLLIALNAINEIIKLIRQAENTAIASALLTKQFELSEKQAKAILEMRLQRLTALEINKLKKEYEELTKFIYECERILENDDIKYSIIKKELIEVKEKYGDERKTQIVKRTQNLDKEDLIPEEENIVTISNKGFIKRLPVNTYKRQKRGGIGVTGVIVKEDDFNEQLIIASTHSYIMFFSNYGRTFYTKIYEIPEGGRITKGKKLDLFLKLSEGETIRACITVKDYKSKETVILITRKGIIKRSLISDFTNAKTRGIKAINLDKDDLLVSALLSKKDSHIILCTKKGKALKIKEESVRVMGRNTRGVIGIRIKADNEIIGIVRTSKHKKLFVITKNGYGKLLNFNTLQKHGRGTGGQIYIKTNEKTGEVVAVHSVSTEEELVLSTSLGMIVKTAVKGISSFGRTASGVKVVNVKKANDYVVSVASTILVNEEDDGSDDEDMPLYNETK